METKIKELEDKIVFLEEELKKSNNNKDYWYDEYMRLLSKISSYKEASNAIMNMLNA